jgi:hypothetical protein
MPLEKLHKLLTIAKQPIGPKTRTGDDGGSHLG